jgi:PAS domain S-box-containing protein
MSVPLKVLILEDSEDDAEFLLRELRHGDFDPDYKLVASPKGMREALQNQTWDIILSDYYMPGFSALTALQILHDNAMRIPFVVITGATGEDIAVEAMRAGANDYLLKHNLRRLVSVVQRELKLAKLKHENTAQCAAIIKQRDDSERIIDSIATSIIVTDREGKVVYFNKESENLSGFTSEEIIGTYLWDHLFADSEKADAKALLQRITDDSNDSSVHNWQIKSDGPLKVRCQWRAAADDDTQLQHIVVTVSKVE